MKPAISSLWHEAKETMVTWNKQQRFTREIGLRMAVDIVMVNMALAVALILRCYWVASVMGDVTSTHTGLGDCVGAYLSSFWLLTPTCIVIFYLAGFYTRDRAYRLRYKALAIAQTVSLAYLIFGFEVLLLRGAVSFPRTVVVIAWFLTLVSLLWARLSVWLWSTLAETERHPTPVIPARDQTQTVLIIGGAGYIGSALTGKLLELGYKVRVLDLLVYGDEAIHDYYANPRFELIKGDFCHINTLVMAMQGVDALVHLGAIVGDAACRLCEELTIEINLRATQTIAEVAKGYGVKRFVFASTCSVYGASDEMLDERSALCPLSLYARTKVASERVLLELAGGAFSPPFSASARSMVSRDVRASTWSSTCYPPRRSRIGKSALWAANNGVRWSM